MVKVFGIGNPLRADDGVGVEAANALQSSNTNGGNPFTPCFEVYTPEIFVEDALDHIRQNDYVILIDAVCLGGAVGDVHRMSLKECERFVTPKAFCHDMSLLHTLLLWYPQIKGELLGIEIDDISYRVGLSFELKCKLPKIIHEIRQQIEYNVII